MSIRLYPRQIWRSAWCFLRADFQLTVERRNIFKRYDRELRSLCEIPGAGRIHHYCHAISTTIIIGMILGAEYLRRLPRQGEQLVAHDYVEVALTLTGLVLTHLLLRAPAIIRSLLEHRARLATRTLPRTAEKLLWFFLPAETCEEAIDHINAQFQKRRELYGAGYARRWYWWQLARLAYPAIERMIERGLKWGLLGWIGRHL